MIESTAAIPVMNDDDLIASTRELARKSNGVEAELLLYLGEIDARKMYRDRASPSMIAFCMREFNFSEGAAANRVFVARAAREMPAILESLRSGTVHLSGLRVLVPLLNDQNCEKVLALAAGKSKREIEEVAASLSPRPAVRDDVRKLPSRELALVAPRETAISVPPPREEHRPVIAPLSADTFKFRFTGSRAFRDKLRQAQDLLRHRIPACTTSFSRSNSTDESSWNGYGRTAKRRRPLGGRRCRHGKCRPEHVPGHAPSNVCSRRAVHFFFEDAVLFFLHSPVFSRAIFAAGAALCACATSS